MHKSALKVKLPQRVFKEDKIQSIATILGEGYRAAKELEPQSFSSSEEDPQNTHFQPPTHTKNTLSVDKRIVVQLEPPKEVRHKRSYSEYARVGAPADKRDSQPVIVEPPRAAPANRDSDAEDMSESERIIRNIIRQRKGVADKQFHSAQEDDSLSKDSIDRADARQEHTEPVAIGFEKRISSILGDIEGERKHEELKRWQVKQHLLELLGTNKDLSQYDEVFYESDVKKSREELSTQQFTEGVGRSSEASNATITGPGSSFLINETYERKKPIPEFHECAKPGPFPRRNRSISTHYKEEQKSRDSDPRLSDAHPLRPALERLLASFRRVKEAVFQVLATKRLSEVVVLLRDVGDNVEFMGLYERAGTAFQRIYPHHALPSLIQPDEVSEVFKLDPLTSTFKRGQGRGRPDAISLEPGPDM